MCTVSVLSGYIEEEVTFGSTRWHRAGIILATAVQTRASICRLWQEGSSSPGARRSLHNPHTAFNTRIFFRMLSLREIRYSLAHATANRHSFALVLLECTEISAEPTKSYFMVCAISRLVGCWQYYQRFSSYRISSHYTTRRSKLLKLRLVSPCSLKCPLLTGMILGL